MGNRSDVTVSLASRSAIHGTKIVEKIERDGEFCWDELLELVSNAHEVGCATKADINLIKTKECNVGRLKALVECLKSKISVNAPSRPGVRL